MSSLACRLSITSLPTYLNLADNLALACPPDGGRDTQSRNCGLPFTTQRHIPQLGHQKSDPDVQPASPPPNAPQQKPRSLRILLVDDSVAQQKLALSILQRVGLQADVAADGHEAVACLSRATYDLVLMDCEMPVMDGYATTRLIRDPSSPVRDHAIPVIALTAHTSGADRRACVLAGMDDFVPKPLTSLALLVTIKRWSVAGPCVAAA